MLVLTITIPPLARTNDLPLLFHPPGFPRMFASPASSQTALCASADCFAGLLSSIGRASIEQNSTRMFRWWRMMLSIVPIVISFLAFAFSIYTFCSKRRDEVKAKRERQAQSISAWLDQEECYKCILRNDSSNPVYSVVLAAVAIQGAAPDRSEKLSQRHLAVFTALPPGDSVYGNLDMNGAMAVVFQLELAFRDSNGINWLRRANGALEEIPRDPIEYFNVGKPVHYRRLQRCGMSASNIPA